VNDLSLLQLNRCIFFYLVKCTTTAVKSFTLLQLNCYFWYFVSMQISNLKSLCFPISYCKFTLLNFMIAWVSTTTFYILYLLWSVFTCRLILFCCEIKFVVWMHYIVMCCFSCILGSLNKDGLTVTKMHIYSETLLSTSINFLLWVCQYLRNLLFVLRWWHKFVLSVKNSLNIYPVLHFTVK